MTIHILNPRDLNQALPSVGEPLSSDDLKFLLADLIENSETNFISAGLFKGTYKNKEIHFLLTNNLLIRPRKKEENQLRVEVLAHKKFGKGGFGKIYESYGVIMPEKDYQFKANSNEKARICKRISCVTEEQSIEIIKEADYTKLNPLLHCKSAVFEDTNGFLVMRRIPKSDLIDLINSLYKGKVLLTLEERLTLTFAILIAYKKQVYDLGLTHNDIKPENIIVDWVNGTATIIDYAFAQPINYKETSEYVYGTTGYIAPELFDLERSVASDIYALGLSIAMLWGYVPQLDFDFDKNFEEYLDYCSHRKWTGLFENINLSDNLKNKITTFLDNMTAFEFKERLSLEESLDKWSIIIKEYDKQQSNNTFISNTQIERKDTPRPNPFNFFGYSPCTEDETSMNLIAIDL